MSQKRYPFSKVLPYLQQNVADSRILQDCIELIELMQNWTGYPSILWNNATVGFGKREVLIPDIKKYKKIPLVGFTPRKKDICLDVFTGLKEHEYLLEHLGEHTKIKSLLYIQTLKRVNLIALETVVYKTIEYRRTQ
ncbi:hypothetical protein [Myroides sp. LJL119]